MNNLFERDDRGYLDDQFDVKLSLTEAVGGLFGSVILVGLIALVQNF